MGAKRLPSELIDQLVADYTELGSFKQVAEKHEMNPTTVQKAIHRRLGTGGMNKKLTKPFKGISKEPNTITGFRDELW